MFATTRLYRKIIERAEEEEKNVKRNCRRREEKTCVNICHPKVERMTLGGTDHLRWNTVV